MKSRSLVPLLPTVVIAIAIGMMLISPAAGRAAAGSQRSYFVAPAGSDALSCSSNASTAPFATIQRALACAGDGDTVNLAPSGAQPYPGIGSVTHEVTIQAQPGADARSVTIDAGKGELSIPAGVEASLDGVTLDCPGNDCAGAPTVTDEGSLTLTADEITGNLTHGAILQTTPAGSSTPAELTLIGSTVARNATAIGAAIDVLPGQGAGGALTLTVSNSTIAGNYAQQVGGGISFIGTTPGSSATITAATITGNTAVNAGGGLASAGYVNLANTILAGNTTHTNQYTDCRDEGVPSGTHVLDGAAGHNLIGDDSGCPGLDAAAAGDQLNASHQGLLALADNGGPTDTVALQAGSPALGAGDAAACAAAPIDGRDQRGDARNSSLRGCDIGAFDTGGAGGAVDRTYYVSPSGSDALSCGQDSAATPVATIQRALACTVDGDVLDLAPSSAQPYPGLGAVTHNVTIQAQPGASARTVAIDAGRGVLSVSPGVNAAVSGLALACPANDCAAAPTVTDEGSLTLRGDELTGNASTRGAILETTPASSSTPASLRVLGSTISGNVATQGGAIDAIPGKSATGSLTLLLANSTIAENRALTAGGGVFFNATTVGSSAAIESTTIIGNAAQNSGGGLAATGQVTLQNTILAANTDRSAPATADCHDEGFPQGTHILAGPSGHNLIGNGDGCPGLAGAGDKTGTTGSLLDPAVGPLAYNGGQTETVPLLGASPAIGGGASGACESPPVGSTDERGALRKASARGVCDIGAFDTSGRPPATRAPVVHAPASVRARESKPLMVKLKAKGTPTAALSESGALPEGVRFVENGDGTAAIAGTPAGGSAGTYTVVLTARNGVGSPVDVSIAIEVRP